MTIVYGLTDQGFVNKPLPIIREDLNAAFQNAFGNSIDLSDRSVLGVIIGIFAERLALLWELLEAITASQDPSKSTGTLLDAIAAITGTVRPGASTSKVTLTLTGTATTVVAAGSRAQTVSTGKSFETIADATIAAVPVWVGTTNYGLAARVTNLGSVYQNIQAGTSAGSGGPIGEASDATPDGGCLWTFVGAGQAAVDVAAEATEVGPIFGSARDIAQIATPVGGWVDVTNLVSASPGRNVALDAELRRLRDVELGNAGSTTFEAILANLLAVQDVSSVTLFTNNTDLTDADGVPPHCVEALVRGGADQDIFDALFASVADGIATSGINRSGFSIDTQGTAHAIEFSRPVEKDIYVRVTISEDSTLYPGDGDADVANAIVAYGALQSNGRDAVAAAIAAQPFTVAGVLDVPSILIFTDVIGASSAWLPSHSYVATLGSRSVVTNGGRSYICTTGGTSAGSGGPQTTAADIVDGTAHWCFLGGNIVIAARELAVFATSRVSVTSSAGTP